MDPPQTPDYYTDLGISENATPREIKKAYNDLVLKVHPDKQAPGACGDSHEFITVQEAYEVLRDKVKRAEYDAYYPNIRAAWSQFREFIGLQAAKEAKRRAAEKEAEEMAAKKEKRKAAKEAKRKAAEDAQRQAEEEEARRQIEEEEARIQVEEIIAMQQSGEEWERQMEAFLEEERRIKTNKAYQWEAIHEQMRKEEIRMQEREQAEAFDEIREQVDMDRRNILQSMEHQRQEELQQVERRYKKMIDKEEEKLKTRLDDETANVQEELESKWAIRRQRNEKIKAVRQAKEEYEALQDLHARQKAWEEKQHKAAEERVKEQRKSEEKKKKREAKEMPSSKECEDEEQGESREQRRAGKRCRDEEEQEWEGLQEEHRSAEADKAFRKARRRQETAAKEHLRRNQKKEAHTKPTKAAKNGKMKRRKMQA